MENSNKAKEKKHRLFFGLAIKPWLSELIKIQQLLKEKFLGMSHQIIWHPIESFHITLVFVGEIDEKLRDEIKEDVNKYFSQTPFPSFEIKATKISILSSRHIIVALDAPLLNDLYDKLHAIIPANEKIKKERAYFAHIALAKLKNTWLAKNVYEQLGNVTVNALIPIKITEFDLFESKPNRQYASLATYVLSNINEDNKNLSSDFYQKWEHFSHDADIGVRGYGKTIAQAFAMAAMALTGVITDPLYVNAIDTVSITCSAPDIEVLLVDWLNAIIFQIETRQMLFSEFHVEINDLQLTATLRGEKIDRKKHHPAVDVKGATFTELKVQQQNELWLAQCVIDV